MELPKIHSDFKDLLPTDMNKTIFAEVAMIDRTNSNLKPRLYILRKEKFFSEQDFDAIKNGYVSFDRDDFIEIGEVLAIDKSKKFILIANDNMLTYNYLIIASSNHAPTSLLMGEEILSGIQALIEAVRVGKDIPLKLTTPRRTRPPKRMPKTRARSEPNKIEQLSKFASPEIHSDMNLSRVLFEVHF